MARIDKRYLPLIMEEAAEVIQICSKILRFGETDTNPNDPNAQMNFKELDKELGDLKAVYNLCGVLDEDVNTASREKLEKLKVFGPDGSYLRDKSKSLIECSF
jgi:NTP pyrophosphatase (non-canonical NTP hydrolase)